MQDVRCLKEAAAVVTKILRPLLVFVGDSTAAATDREAWQVKEEAVQCKWYVSKTIKNSSDLTNWRSNCK